MIFKYLKFLKAPVGKIVSINRIETFSVEEDYDFVRIYDGLASKGSLLVEFTGNMASIGSILSSENIVEVVFTR